MKNKIKTTITKILLPEDNQFGIKNYGDYTEVVIISRITGTNPPWTTQMSFPLHFGYTEEHQVVKDAIQKCVDTTTKSLREYLDRKKTTKEK